MLLGKRVHSRPSREIVGGLGTAMQHHDQREPLMTAIGGNVKPVFARAGGIGVGRRRERGPFRYLRGGMGISRKNLDIAPTRSTVSLGSHAA